MTVKTRQIGPCFAAEVEGIDMRKPLTAEEVAAVHAGMDEFAVLVFHDQHIDDEQQLAFSRSLGQLEKTVGASLRAPEDYRLPTTFAGCSPSATGSGIPTARSRSCPRSTRCCTPAASRPGAATRSSPTCARPTTPSTTRQ